MMWKGTLLQISHKWYCLIAWIVLGVGITLTALSRFVFWDNNFFFRIVDPYVSLVLVFSIIPVGPILFVGILVQALRKKLTEEKLIPHIILFVSSAVIWIAFVCLFVAWTGGV